jgi:hypothetical protein
VLEVVAEPYIPSAVSFGIGEAAKWEGPAWIALAGPSPSINAGPSQPTPAPVNRM